MQFRLRKPLGFSERGQKPINEDSIQPEVSKMNTSTRCFVLCDGLGGDTASRTVATTLQQELTMSKSVPDTMTGRRWSDAMQKSYEALNRLTYSAEKKPATTMTCLYFGANGVLAAHIGDSRIYQIRPGVGIIFRTEDHSLINSLLKSGQITPEEARNHPRKHVITRAMQPGQEIPCKADAKILTEVRGGDYFFMCSDGILENIEDNQLVEILSRNIGNEAKLEIIYDKCYGRTRDNYSCVLIQVENVIKNDAGTREKVVNTAEGISNRKIEAVSDAKDEEKIFEYKYKGPNGWIKLLIALGITIFILAMLFIIFRAPSKKELNTEAPKVTLEEPAPVEEQTNEHFDYVDPRDSEPGNIVESWTGQDSVGVE